MDSESTDRYNYECTEVYTQEQMDGLLNAVKNMFGLQILANDGTMLVNIDDYNKFVKVVNDLQHTKISSGSFTAVHWMRS